MLKGFIFIVVKFISAVEPRQLLTSAYRSCGEEARKKLTPTCLNGMSDYADSYTKIKGGNIVGSSTTPGYYAHALATKTYVQVDVYNLKASAPSGWIAQDLNTHNLFDSSSVYLEITKGSLYFYPYSSSSPARAYASGYNDKTSAIQSADTGGSIVKSYASAAMVGFNPIARAL